MKKIILILILIIVLVPTAVSAAPSKSGLSSVKIPGGPKFYIGNVERGVSVTVGFKDYPEGKTYQVRMGLPGNNFGSGYIVGTVNDAKAPNFRKSFPIPTELKHKTHIAIYIIDWSDNSHGYNIFANDTGFNEKWEMSFTPVYRSSAQSAGKSVGIFNGPTVWIGSQGYPNTFNVAFDDFYMDGSYTIFIGPNIPGQPSIVAGYADQTNGPRFTKELQIPDSLKGEDSLKVAVVSAFNQHSGSMAFLYQEGYPYIDPIGNFSTIHATDSYGSFSTATPFTNILNVVPDGEVTLQVFNFPPDKDFIVTMGPLGTRGIGGYVIGTQNSGEGGSYIVTYPIPPVLHGSDFSSIRMESTSSGHFVYDYFENGSAGTSQSPGSGTATGDSPTAGDGTGDVPIAADPASGAGTTSAPGNGDWVLAPGTYPLTSIDASLEGTSVTVSGTNFTLNDSYTVRMGAMGTKGVGGYVVVIKVQAPVSRRLHFWFRIDFLDFE
ncbi:MAG: hypothetical protein P8Y68_20270 [Anaerolineales bacterium]